MHSHATLWKWSTAKFWSTVISLLTRNPHFSHQEVRLGRCLLCKLSKFIFFVPICILLIKLDQNYFMFSYNLKRKSNTLEDNTRVQWQGRMQLVKVRWSKSTVFFFHYAPKQICFTPNPGDYDTNFPNHSSENWS